MKGMAFRGLRASLDARNPLFVQVSFGEARVLQRLGRTEEAIAVLEAIAGGKDFMFHQRRGDRLHVFLFVFKNAFRVSVALIDNPSDFVDAPVPPQQS